MPIIDEEYTGTDLHRAIVYGEAKTRKTWWCTRAAELGYNVILADFDHGWHVTKQLPMEARKRIFHIDMRMPADTKNKNSAFATMAVATKGDVVFYDDAQRIKATPKTFTEDGTYTKLDLMSATSRDVLILDSWTAICHQIGEYNETTVDPLKVADYTEQSVYKILRTHADRLMTNLQRLPCHVIIVGHAVEYAKRKADARAKDKPEDAIEWIKTIPASVTKDHGRQMAKDASDVFFFDVANGMNGTDVYVSTRGNDSIIVGSRTVAPARKKWEDFGIEALLPPLSEISPNFNSKAVSTVKGSEILASASTSGGSAPKLDATKTPTINIGKTT